MKLSRRIIPVNFILKSGIWKRLLKKLEKLYPETKYVTRLMAYSWGQKVIRFYDLDGNLIEVRTPMRG